MREIKFRSWDNRNKIMDIPDNIANDIDGDKYQIMQYTGLKDRNGKEIYEGDMVKADWGQGELIAEIMFEDGAFVLGIRDDCYRDMAGEDNNLYYEIIGNIYENSELLKEK